MRRTASRRWWTQCWSGQWSCPGSRLAGFPAGRRVRLSAGRRTQSAAGTQAPGAMASDCTCRRRLNSGELDLVTNILECERLGNATGDTRGLCYHASVPLWLGGRTLGVMNLVGPEKGLFTDNELRVLYGIGHQVAVALERAHLREHMERLVQEKTATLEAEVVRRRRIEKEQGRLVAIIEATPDLVATGDPNGQALYYNQAGLRMLGFEPGLDPSTTRLFDTHPDWAAKLVMQDGIPHAIEHGAWAGETALLRRDGREIPISQVIIAHKGSDGSLEYLSTIARDITLQKEHERHITRLNRVYAVLSGVNTSIVRIRDRQELFWEACRIAVELGKFRFAWIGLLDANGLDVTPVASAGVGEGYLDNIQLTARDDAPDCCELVKRALRERTAVVCNDVDTDPQMARWRQEALRRGYRSVVVLPLRLGDKAIGLLLLYAAEAGFFDTAEMGLLTEIAGDLSFALDHLEKGDRLDYLAYYDALTGLPNRSLLRDRLGQKARAARRDESAFATVILNVERFRNVNDTLGQHAGDELLRQIARRLKDGLGQPDTLARLGADSFALVTRRCDDDGTVGHILERVLSCIHGQPFEIDGRELRIAVKAGVAVFPHDGEDADTLLRNAEAALAKAKRAGERYLFYAPEFNARVAEKLTLENKLRRAVERGELVLHYQPKVELENRRINGFEALMRWNDPDTGLLVPPLEFIPTLEETGLILEARKLRAIREMGVEIAVDDFGTGYSSLSYISRLPINTLKIDRAFITNMTRKPEDLSIVSTIISLGHSLELRVVAECVETEEQANLLRRLKCDQFQGYLYSPAVPVEQIEILLQENKSPPRSPG
ncbi:MAG: EAL domain-containing protein [Betaproteobacteria bacterium]|nr:EAL domain-containing protein [Betaproteobacteria bacterium]